MFDENDKKTLELVTMIKKLLKYLYLKMLI